MAVVNEIPSIASGVVNTANGVFMVNDLSDNDPRKAPVFDSRQDALTKLDNSPFARVEGLVLKAKLNGKTVQYVFDGGITDDDFVLFSGSSKSQIKPLQVFDNENIVTVLNNANAFTLDNPENTLIKSVFTDSVTSIPIEIRLYHIITEPILSQYNILPGAFGTGGQTFHSSNLELSNTVNLTGQDIEELEDTVTYEYDTGAVDVVDYINALNPSIVVANPNTNLTIFKITTNGVLTDYLYTGSGATYGLNDTSIDIGDLQILETESESVSQQDIIPSVVLDADLLDNTVLLDSNIYKGIIVFSEESNTHFFWNGLDRTDASNWIIYTPTLVPVNDGPGVAYRLANNIPISGFTAGEGSVDFTKKFGIFNDTNGAYGAYSMAVGRNSRSFGDYSLSIGYLINASGNYSQTFGFFNNSFGNYSTSFGQGNRANSINEFVIGSYSTIQTSNNNNTDRVFNIGIGVNQGDREDAFSIFKNGALEFFRATLASITNAMAGMLIFNSDDNNRPTIHNGTEWHGLAYKLKEYTVATLPTTPTAGEEAIVTDGDTVSYRATVTSGGSEYVKVMYDGTNWIYN